MSSRQNTVLGERGFSLVELLVAMVIGLVGTIIIFQVFSASEGMRRTTSAGGDAQQTGAIALYAIQHDLRNAGMGFSDTQYAGCTVHVYDKVRSPATYTFPLLPVFITPGADAQHADTLAILYGSQALIVNSTTLSADFTNPTNPIRVSNTFGYRVGDLLVLLQPPPTATECILMEVTGPAAPAATDTIVHAPGGGSRFNPSGGFSGYSYVNAGTANAPRVYNLGNYLDANSVPVFNIYSISGTTLQYVSGFSANPTAPLAVADNIVHMRAQYVMRDGTYKAPDLAAPPVWADVVGVRVAVVARSRLPEKASAAVTTPGTPEPCDTTTSFPTWSGGSFDLSLDANWMCYRYRAFETTVPLRNWVWSNS